MSDDEAIYATVHDVMAELWERGKPLPVHRLKHSVAVDLLAVENVSAPPVGWFASGKEWFACADENRNRRGPIVR